MKMALHARLFKHNILRVSKLKNLSHTTQAVDLNNDKTPSSCCRPSVNAISEEDKNHEARKQDADTWPLSLSVPQWSIQQFSLDFLDISSWTSPSTSRSLTVRPDVNMITSDRHIKQKKNLSIAELPQDNLPLVYKSETSILVRPWDKNSQRRDDGTTCKSPDAIKSQTPLYCSLTTNIHCQEAEFPKPHKSLFRRHSICDSNPTRHQTDLTDCSILQCGSATNTVFCSSGSHTGATLHTARSDVRQSSGGSDTSAGKDGQGPSFDQLKAVETYFIDTLPNFFKAKTDYRVYHPDIVFENNFWGKNEVFVGISQYAMQMIKLRALTHLKYAHVHMELVSSACIHDEGKVRIHWRIVGLSQFKALRFWKYTVWSYGSSFREDAEWLEGISILHVNKDGQVFKHRLDRVSPDEEQLAKAPSLAAKLALLFGLGAPKPGLSDFSSLLCRQ